jgi:hypothetical protein
MSIEKLVASAWGGKGVEKVIILYLPLRQGFFGKKRFNDRSKGLRFGQQPVKYTSRNFYKILKLKEFFEAVVCCLAPGIMEYWNVFQFSIVPTFQL